MKTHHLNISDEHFAPNHCSNQMNRDLAIENTDIVASIPVPAVSIYEYNNRRAFI